MKRFVKFYKKFTVATAIMIFITAVALLPGCGPGQTTLVLSDPQTDRVYASYPVEEGDVFTVEFIHSVNKSPVRDYYECRPDGIWNTQCVYYGFGAGVEEILLDGEELTYGDNGEMIVSGIDHRIDPLIIVVGTISDHILTIGGEEISLRDLCGRSSKVLFSLKQE